MIETQLQYPPILLPGNALHTLLRTADNPVIVNTH